MGIAKNLTLPMPLWQVTLPLWMGGLLALFQVFINPVALSRFFVYSHETRTGSLGPLAFGSAVVLLLLASLANYFHSGIRSRFSTDPSLLKRMLALFSLAAACSLQMIGLFIVVLGPAALSIMEIS